MSNLTSPVFQRQLDDGTNVPYWLAINVTGGLAPPVVLDALPYRQVLDVDNTGVSSIDLTKNSVSVCKVALIDQPAVPPSTPATPNIQLWTGNANPTMSLINSGVSVNKPLNILDPTLSNNVLQIKSLTGSTSSITRNTTNNPSYIYLNDSGSVNVQGSIFTNPAGAEPTFLTGSIVAGYDDSGATLVLTDDVVSGKNSSTITSQSTPSNNDYKIVFAGTALSNPTLILDSTANVKSVNINSSSIYYDAANYWRTNIGGSNNWTLNLNNTLNALNIEETTGIVNVPYFRSASGIENIGRLTNTLGGVYVVAGGGADVMNGRIHSANGDWSSILTSYGNEGNLYAGSTCQLGLSYQNGPVLTSINIDPVNIRVIAGVNGNINLTNSTTPSSNAKLYLNGLEITSHGTSSQKYLVQYYVNNISFDSGNTTVFDFLLYNNGGTRSPVMAAGTYTIQFSTFEGFAYAVGINVGTATVVWDGVSTLSALTTIYVTGQGGQAGFNLTTPSRVAYAYDGHASNGTLQGTAQCIS